MSSLQNSSSSKRRKTDDNDAITILEKVAEFQSRTGANPTPANMRLLFESLKDDLRVELAGPHQLYNRIRHKYYQALEAGGSATITSPYQRMFFDLSINAWGEDYRRKPVSTNGGGTLKKQKLMRPAMAAAPVKDEEIDVDDNNNGDGNGGDEEMEDAVEEVVGEPYKFLEHQAREYWAMAGLPEDTLEMGIKSMDRVKARVLERMWAQHMEASLKLQVEEFELDKELYVALLTAQKNSK